VSILVISAAGSWFSGDVSVSILSVSVLAASAVTSPFA
jgi:hypothetical protein